MNQQKLQMFMLCLRSIYARMTFNFPLMLNKVGSEKIPLPQAHMLFRCAVYSDSYLDTNPKIAIYRDTVFRGDTHPYLKPSLYFQSMANMALSLYMRPLTSCFYLDLETGCLKPLHDLHFDRHACDVF